MASPVDNFKDTTKKMANKLQELAKSKDDQKKLNNMVKEINKIRTNMEKDFEKIAPYIEKEKIDKQVFYNASNSVKRALNDPSEGNINNAVSKINELISKFAA